MSDKTLSIIIVNYRSERILKNCLASIYGKINPEIDFEIIIVNNDRQEKLNEISLAYPGVEILNSKNNRGYGAGNNLGARRARGSLLFFLNPDTEILSENIQKIISLFLADNSLGILGSRILTLEDKVQKWIAGPQTSLINLIKNNLGLDNYKEIEKVQKPEKVDRVSGTALFIRKELFKTLGGFDENLFMYFEDEDLCQRVRNLGQKVLYFPEFSVRHVGGESYPEKKQQKKDYYRSQEYYFKKHRPIFERLVVKILKKIIQ